MCQTVAYVIEEGKEVPVLEDVISVSPEDGCIRMVNLFGEEKVVSGRISSNRPSYPSYCHPGPSG